MNKNGYILLDIVVGTFLIGLISITFFPMIVSSFNNFNIIKNKSEMIYIGEMVIERLKTDKDLSAQIIPILENQNSLDFNHILIDENYICNLNRIKSTDRFMDIKVSVSRKNQENSYNVDFKASIPKQ